MDYYLFRSDQASDLDYSIMTPPKTPSVLESWKAEIRIVYQTPAEFKSKKVIDILEVNESAWALRCRRLIELVEKKDLALRAMLTRNSIFETEAKLARDALALTEDLK